MSAICAVLFAKIFKYDKTLAASQGFKVLVASSDATMHDAAQLVDYFGATGIAAKPVVVDGGGAWVAALDGVSVVYLFDKKTAGQVATVYR
ncbi:MAG: hypothetical protein GY930_14335 [bacterium]|nr:hypothetical protein [bacterium]